MFEQTEVSAELDARLMMAGLDPSDPTVQAIKSAVSGYFAERTVEVLTKVQQVLDRFSKEELH